MKLCSIEYNLWFNFWIRSSRKEKESSPFWCIVQSQSLPHASYKLGSLEPIDAARNGEGGWASIQRYTGSQGWSQQDWEGEACCWDEKLKVTLHTRLLSIFDIDKSVLHRQPREFRKLTYSICRLLRKVQKGRRNVSSWANLNLSLFQWVLIHFLLRSFSFCPWGRVLRDPRRNKLPSY